MAYDTMKQNLSWMPPTHDAWEYTLFRSIPEVVTNLESLRTGDIDGDGRTEIITGGDGALIWYRASTAESGVIGWGHFGVALALEDIDGDGVPEVVAIRERPDRTGVWQIVAFKAPVSPGGEWQEWPIVPEADGEAHDLAFADLDGDGVTELIADAPYCDAPGTLAYKRGEDHTAPWTRYQLVAGRAHTEAIAIADLDGDGRLEIVHGPDWYTQPEGGAFSGPWQVRHYAPSLRDNCRVDVFDITGNGKFDIICAESEYEDGRLAWFENRLEEDPEVPWIEHPLEWGLYYGHSLAVWRDPKDNEVRILMGEMAQGGYGAPRNWHARLLEYRIGLEGTHRRLISREGTHEARVADVDDDGEMEIVGKNWREPAIQIWRRRPGPSFASQFQHHLIERDKLGAAKAIVPFDVNRNGKLDLMCGANWYVNPTWERRELPGVTDVLGVFDGEGFLATLADGQLAIVSPQPTEPWKYERLEGCFDVAAAVTVAASDGDAPSVVVGSEGAPLRSFSRGADGGWSSRELGQFDIAAGITVADLDGDGRPDLLLGDTWLRNDGGGTFTSHRLISDLDLTPLSTAVGGLAGDGPSEIIVCTRGPNPVPGSDPPLARLFILRPGRDGSWQKQLVDSLREPRSLALADVDGDGDLEIICGEHDSSNPYRTQSRLYVYKRADPEGRAWTRHTLDDRFEHDRGPCVFEIEPGRVGIASHGTSDIRYLHLWERTGAERTESSRG